MPRTEKAAIVPASADRPDLKRNFIVQQGLPEPPAESCPLQYSGLLFQPRILGPTVLVAALIQEPVPFALLAALLWWNALVPRLNPFDALYDRTVARRAGRVTLPPAPGPRRFAQGVAGTVSLAIAEALFEGWRAAALGLEVFLLVAIAALVFGGLCLGSFLFHLLAGRARFAVRTLPWGRGA